MIIVKTARWLLAVIIGIAAALFIAERLLCLKHRPGYTPHSEPVAVNAFSDGSGRHIAGSLGYQNSWDDKGYVKVEINSLGLRGPEYADPKSPDRLRIFFVGDSIVFGTGLEFKDTITQQLEGLLNRGRTSPYCEVINGGVGDSNLEAESLLIQEKMDILKPDIILLGVYLNDLSPPAGYLKGMDIYRNHLLYKCHQVKWIRESNIWNYALKGLERRINSAMLFAYISGNIRHLWVIDYNGREWLEDPAEFKNLVYKARYDWGMAWDEGLWGRGFGLIKQIQGICSSRNIKFAVVILPVEPQVLFKGDLPVIRKPQDMLAAFLGDMRIPCLDMLSVLRVHKDERIFYDHCHFTPFGASLVAGEISAFLEGIDGYAG
ncbi:MAG: hypothetical protein PHR44_01820 [Candidatus Omnitrophica bacterium]|nr:hypothetical protein [Candidatus Omnitrophota bacterium]